MKQIGDLFAKYKKTLRPPQATVEKKVVQIISELIKIDLTMDQVSYNTSTRMLKINAPSIIRSEIVRRKGEILKNLSGELGEATTPKELM